jgi:exopolyphosphatase / guanosine-5'-triphosphate,3'-diphosphate pyrophosphatase
VTSAVIDIGTNSVLLLVAEGGKAVVDRAIITRLGQGVDASGKLHPDAVERTLEAVRRHAAEARSLGAKPFATGTSALRDAANRDAFLAPAREILGRDVCLLSGDEEAELTYRGGLAGLDLPHGVRTVVDIGGGSTEIVVGDEAGIRSKVSLQVGSVRLSERFVRADPPAPEEVEALRAQVRGLLATTAPVAPLVAVAGTATTLSAMHLGLEPYDPGRVHGHRLGRADLAFLVDRLLAVPLAERSRIRGVEPARAEVLPAGALLLAEIMDRAGAAEAMISDRGLRWGVREALDSGRLLL